MERAQSLPKSILLFSAQTGAQEKNKDRRPIRIPHNP